nr:hypothetical protein BaRGS_023493 [Batillaria attramentaria]
MCAFTVALHRTKSRPGCLPNEVSKDLGNDSKVFELMDDDVRVNGGKTFEIDRNIIVLIVFAYSKRMRTRTNLFLANLAVADFCVGVFCVLPSLFVFLSPVWILGQVL